MRRALRDGMPLVAIAAVAIAAIAVLLVKIDSQTDRGVTAFAEFSATREGCAIEFARSFNAKSCDVVRPGSVYRIAFLRSLANTTPIVSRGTCCRGPALASVARSNRAVFVFFPGHVRRSFRASVLLP